MNGERGRRRGGQKQGRHGHDASAHVEEPEEGEREFERGQEHGDEGRDKLRDETPSAEFSPKESNIEAFGKASDAERRHGERGDDERRDRDAAQSRQFSSPPPPPS